MPILFSLFIACQGQIKSSSPTSEPSGEPSSSPTSEPSAQPSGEPSGEPSSSPTSEPSGEPSSSPTSEPVEEEDYAQTGPYTVTSTSGTANVTNCSAGMEYQVYTPSGVADPEVLVLGHGFLRSGKMVAWGEHFASWGVEVLVPTLCHFNIVDGVDHEMNGQNMVELAEFHGATNPIYGGQSAGGLAAIIAASMDSDTMGVLGLDATDTEGVPGVPDFIGQSYAGSVSVPTLALVGEPSTCNSQNNGINLFEMMSNVQVLRVRDSDHCDYENPTDWGCTSFCLNETTSFDDAQILPVIAHLSTAAVLALAGDSNAQAAWNDSAMQDWISSGLIERLQ